MAQVRTYPGMTDSSTEFFLENDELKAVQNGKIKSFTEIPFGTIGILKEEMHKCRIQGGQQKFRKNLEVQFFVYTSFES